MTMFRRWDSRAARVVLPALYQQRVPGPLRARGTDRRQLRDAGAPARATAICSSIHYDDAVVRRVPRRRLTPYKPLLRAADTRARRSDGALYTARFATFFGGQRTGRRRVARADRAVARPRPVHDARRDQSVPRRRTTASSASQASTTSTCTASGLERHRSCRWDKDYTFTFIDIVDSFARRADRSRSSTRA